jgi:ferrochelatase
VRFDALLLVSFGGPQAPEEVVPFLERVTAGKGVPRERLEQVARNYMELDGLSPINARCRDLLASLQDLFARRRPGLAIYWGNRHSAPFLSDTLRQMRDDGVRRAAAFATSAYSSYSSCRQYIEDIEKARRQAGAGAPEVIKLPPYFDHPGFIDALAEGLAIARSSLGKHAPVLMTAHSIPVSMAAVCDYEKQLARTASLVASAAGLDPGSWSLVFQSRSGRPSDPWLGPDLLETIAGLPSDAKAVVVAPIGFVLDHMEVVYDIDRQATAEASRRGIRLVRSPTPASHPSFVRMVAELMDEAEVKPRQCAPGCCPVAAPPLTS